MFCGTPQYNVFEQSSILAEQLFGVRIKVAYLESAKARWF
uniref:Uncharacterized protein n=1 Tax=Utricularia reniformis TaxID=192314 RepID=A0A1Y0AZC8_9LAMI|nr:hypothetical protein AEK19_MT0259 [Utricularia reniformis]ART30536.1 hypothetical protein AEK19_MT0259 [Utricularia reniformis]